MKLYGIWCKDKTDWLREEMASGLGREPHVAILAFQSERKAQQRAALVYYAFKSYTDAKRKGWCEVRRL